MLIIRNNMTSPIFNTKYYGILLSVLKDQKKKDLTGFLILSGLLKVSDIQE